MMVRVVSQAQGKQPPGLHFPQPNKTTTTHLSLHRGSTPHPPQPLRRRKQPGRRHPKQPRQRARPQQRRGPCAERCMEGALKQVHGAALLAGGGRGHQGDDEQQLLVGHLWRGRGKGRCQGRGSGAVGALVLSPLPLPACSSASRARSSSSPSRHPSAAHSQSPTAPKQPSPEAALPASPQS